MNLDFTGTFAREFVMHLAVMRCVVHNHNTLGSTEFTEYFWTFSIVLYSKKHDVSETGSVSVLR
jgi:hypothetical protein